MFLETTGLEPVTPYLQSRYSTFELRPPCIAIKDYFRLLVCSS